MTRIGIDCRFGSTLGGLGSYVRGLARALAQYDRERTYVLFVRSDAEPWLSELRSNTHVEVIRAPFPHYSLSEQLHFPRVIRKARLDLLLVPHFNVPLYCPVPFICTVHDLILHRYPNEASLLKRIAYALTMRSALKRAKAVITISAATQSELTKRYPFTHEKSTVMYLCIAPIFSPRPQEEVRRVRANFGLGKPFFLYVGNCKEHKNVPMLLEAFERANLHEHELVLVAGGKECELLMENGKCPPGRSSRTGRENCIRLLSSISEADLAALYSCSAGCVTATLAEGFCLPLIEAMACGCPVLATNIGPIPEVCGEHALLVEPAVDGLASGFRTLATDPAVRDPDRLRRAREWSRRYSWENASRHYLDLIERSIRE